MCGGGEDPICGESLGDGVQTPTGEKLGEDSLHHRSRYRIGFEPPELLAGRRLGVVGVRAGVDELVAVGWSSTEESAFDGRLGSHGRSDSGFDAVAFAFAHPPVEAHHQVVSIGAGIDGTTDFRNPQFDPVVDEDGESESELVAVESPLRFADHHAAESPCRVREGFEKA